MSGWWHLDNWCHERLPSYSTDLNAAFAAAEKAHHDLRDPSKLTLLSTSNGRDDDGGWMCTIGNHLDARASFAPTPALAICAAILKLKEEA